MNPKKRLILSLRVLLAVVGLVALLLVSTLYIAITYSKASRQNALGYAQDQVLRFAAGAQTGLNRGLLGVDVLLASMDDLLLSSSRNGRPIDSVEINRLLRSGVDQTMLVRNVVVVSTEGELIASSDRDAPLAELTLPKGFLQKVRASPVYAVSISDPSASEDAADRLLYFGRTVKMAGERRLVVVAQVPVVLLESILAQGLTVNGLEVTLERPDGQVLASVPAMKPDHAIKPAPVTDLLVSGAVDELSSRLSGAPALLSAHRTLYRGLRITTALPMDHALAQWQSERKTVTGAAGMLAFLILLAGAFAIWYLSRLGRVTARQTESRLVLDQALDSMTGGFFLLDAQGRVLKWNAQYEEIIPGVHGRLTPMMDFHKVFELVSHEVLPDVDEQVRRAWVDARATHLLNTTGLSEVAYPSGKTVQVVLRRTPNGGIVGVVNDVTEEKKDQANLRVAAIAFESQEGMLVTDAQNRILRTNRAFTQITGYEAHEVLGQTPRVLSSGHHDASFYQSMWQSLGDTGQWQGEILNRRKNGESYPEHLTITAVKDDLGVVTHYVATMLDITLRKAAAEEIERLAFYDPLTGLPNRRLLMDRLRQAMAASARSTHWGALLFLDLDHFKVLNDTLGHDIGDEMLRQVAGRLSAAVRDGDTVARLGGDEFVLLLENFSGTDTDAAEQARVVGEKVRVALHQPYLLASHHHHGSCSIGAVLFSGTQQTVDDLLKQSDLALYSAKTAGRNSLGFFDPKMQASISARAALETDLRVALADGQFVLHYQPQVTHQGEVVGAEVLIRWMHPQRGMVPPLDFIPLAEETGLILPIGLWVLRTACAQLKVWQSVPSCCAIPLAVNVSARQFHQSNFVEQVTAVLQQTGAPAQLLKLELTESTVLDDVSETIDKMHALKVLGVRFAIDDFGTGQSSLSYLTRLPLDQLKIDQSFVRNLGITPADALIVQTIVGMAKNLGLEVIAEGVETQEQRAFLELHDCTLCQGYLFGRPVPLADFERSLQRMDFQLPCA
jgi:diguanylate cyclase (GGDEF)-like protein/PAS domain S-box-containing protein